MPFFCNLIQTFYTSPLGTMLLAATPQGLAGTWFTDQQHLPPGFGTWPPEPAHPVLALATRQLDAYFAQVGTPGAPPHLFDLPLDLHSGTAFQQSVWQAVRRIPLGSSQSYGQLAAALGNPQAVRAVGAAVGRNPLGIIIPCHRVMGAKGALTGYAGGLDRKIALLQREGFAVSSDQHNARTRLAPVQSESLF